MIVDYETYKQVTGDVFTAQSAVEQNLVRAQARAERITGRQFDKVQRTESLGMRDGLMWPRAYPVESVSLPSGATVSEDAVSIKLTSTNWLSDPTLVPFLAANQSTPYYTVTYLGGFGPGEAPIDLVDAICELAQRYGLPANTAAIPAGATSVSVNGQAFSGAKLGGAATVPPALMAEFRKFTHVSARMAD